MLGNEVTGRSVNTRGSPLPWPGGGYRIAVKMETSIKLICQPFGHRAAPLDEPDCSQRERDLEAEEEEGNVKASTPNLAAHKQRKAARTAQRRRLAELPKQVNTRREGVKEGKTHSSPRSVVVEVGEQKPGESDSASAWVAFLRKPLAATAGPEFIVLGFPEQGFVLSLGFRGHLPP